MAALINEQQSYQDIDGKPIVNGFIYVGLPNADTKSNLIAIFADRNFTIPLANPQRTDSFGKSVNKIWVKERHSLLIENVNNVQILSDPDAGEEIAAGFISLNNVQGNNNITANAIPPITEYEDKRSYIFSAAGINTTSMTLDIDGVGSLSLLKEHDKEMGIANIEQNQIVVAVFNEADNVFEVTSQVANDGQNEITIWSGNLGDIPVGRVLCNGLNGTPDLRNFFVIGAGDTHNPGDTGGSLITGGHAITEAEMASHFHSLTGVVAQSQNAELDNDVLSTNILGNINTNSKGGDNPHTHPQNLPPFFALAYIMKL